MDSLLKSKPDSATNPFVTAARVYKPLEVQSITDALEAISTYKDWPYQTSKDKLLEPMKQICNLIPELIDQVASDLLIFTNFGIRARANLKNHPQIITLLKQFAEIGQRIIQVGQKAVDFSNSGLKPVLHSLDLTHGGHTNMSKKVHSGKFGLSYKNFQLPDNPELRSANANRAKTAFDNLQKLLSFSNEHRLSEELDEVIQATSKHAQKAFDFMTNYFASMLEMGLKELEKMLDTAIKIKEDLPEQLKTLMDTQIGEIFKKSPSPIEIKTNSLKFLGAEVYRITAPVEDLLNEPEK